MIGSKPERCKSGGRSDVEKMARLEPSCNAFGERLFPCFDVSTTTGWVALGCVRITDTIWCSLTICSARALLRHSPVPLTHTFSYVAYNLLVLLSKVPGYWLLENATEKPKPPGVVMSSSMQTKDPRILKYALAASGLLAGAGGAQADIIHFDYSDAPVTADEYLGVYNFNGSESEWLGFSESGAYLSGSSQGDIRASVSGSYSYRPGSKYSPSYYSRSKSSQISLFGPNVTSGLVSDGEVIDQNASFLCDNCQMNVLTASSYSNSYSGAPSRTETFSGNVGFRIDLTPSVISDDDYLYGWARIGGETYVQSGGATARSTVSVYEMAYENNSSQGIAVGQTESVPEPSALGLLAMGAAGLVALRGRRKNRKGSSSAEG